MSPYVRGFLTEPEGITRTGKSKKGSQHQIKINQKVVIKVIDDEAKLREFEDDKKKIDNQVKKKLGIMTEKDRKFL